MAAADDDASPSGLERLVFFSDAVFAIAITLLVLPLSGSPIADDQVGKQILDLAPKAFSFALSFLIIGLVWIGHPRAFALIGRADPTLMVLNLLVLMIVAFLPFPTAVLGEHGNTTAAAVLYGASMSGLGLLSALVWYYASHRGRLIKADAASDAVRATLLRSLIVPVCYLPSIPLAFVSIPASNALWLSSIVLEFVVLRFVQRGRRRGHP